MFAKISLDTSDYDKGVENATKSGESLASKLRSGLATAGKVAAAGIGVVTTAAGAAAGALSTLESATEEYRVAQGKLNTAFDAAGLSADAAREAYYGFYGILGDVDTATEASQLLAKLVEDEKDVVDWTDIAAGVYGTFGDSLPIEGLIEASNETAKVGQVTGVLADALNWVGISEDEFNERLGECSSESERNQLIMETLSGTYDEAASAFYKNNQALVKSRDAQTMLMNAMSKLATTVQTVKTGLISDFLPSIVSVVDALNGMLSGTEGASEQFATAVQGLVNQGVSLLPQFLSFGTQILTSLLSGIVQSIPMLVSAVPQIVSEIGSALMGLFPQVVAMGSQLIDQLTSGLESAVPNMIERAPVIIEEFLNFITENLPGVLDKGVEMLNNFVTGILDAIPDMVAKLPQIIMSFTNFIADNLPVIVNAGIDLIGNLVKGIINAIPSLVANLPQIITAIVNGLGNLSGSVVEAGKDIIRGLWEGISDMAGWISEKIQGFGDGVLSALKDFFGIESPSKLFENEVGKYLAQGIGVGFEDEMDRVASQMQRSIPTPEIGTVDFASSGIGTASAGMVNGISSAVQSAGNGATYTFNILLPDGTKLASYTFQPMVDYARANGTPILSPT